MIRIIVVEDDPMVAQLNAAYLDRLEGFSVRGIFPNGQQALEFLRENPVELAIVDVYMPVCGGVELLRRMRSERIRTAVIMITASTFAGVQVRAGKEKPPDLRSGGFFMMQTGMAVRLRCYG